jgi:Fe-S cluster assembly protein SufD
MNVSSVYEAVTARRNGAAPDWWRRLRAEGLERFEYLGLPTVRDEEWKYTNVRTIADTEFGLCGSVGEADLNVFATQRTQGIAELVFVDGLYSAEASRLDTLPEGIRVDRFEDALDRDPDRLQACLTRAAVSDADAFTSLNIALLDNGVLIRADADATCTTPIQLTFITTAAAEHALMSPRVLIDAGINSRLAVVESHVSQTDASYMTNHLTDILIGRGGQVEYCLLQAQGFAAAHVGTTRVWQEADSRLEAFALETGAALGRQNLVIEIEGAGAHASLDGIYLLHDGQHLDNHTSVVHHQPSCTSDQLYKGILNGASRAVFNGKIFVEKDAQLTNAYQLNRNLLLHPKAKVDTKPQLEIYADDVRCTHGATIGQLDDEEIFYLRSRGIEETSAITMLARGFAAEVLGRVSGEETVKMLKGCLDGYFFEYARRGDA